jgi:teichuronic acid biosynthesis glycosyltransferase TuaC
MWPTASAPHRGIFVQRQVDSIRQLGAHIDVMTIDGAESYLRYLGAALRVVRLHFGRRRWDVIHAHTGHSGIIACLQLRYPVVLSYVGYDLDGLPEGEETLRTRFERAIFRQLSLVIAGTIAKSSRGRDALPKRGRSRNEVLPNGVDRSLFTPMCPAEAREELGWDTRSPVVLFAADPRRFTKRFELAEAAVQLARAKFPDLELRATTDVAPDEMPLWMNASDALLLTSRSEGSPNVIKEAMATNLPIVSVDVGDVRSIIAGTRHCHVCSEEPQDLASALTSVLRALPERSDGRQRSSGLDAILIADRLTAIYRRAAGRGPGLLGFLSRRRQSVAHSRHLLGD